MNAAIAGIDCALPERRVTNADLAREHPDWDLPKIVERAVQAVKWALEYTNDVEFSAEDAVRSEMDFLVRIFAHLA